MNLRNLKFSRDGREVTKQDIVYYGTSKWSVYDGIYEIGAAIICKNGGSPLVKHFMPDDVVKKMNFEDQVSLYNEILAAFKEKFMS